MFACLPGREERCGDMHIRELVLNTCRLEEQQAFYGGTLGLPLLDETGDAFTVQAGETRLRWRAAREEALYHVAFTLPRNRYAEAKRWIGRRVPLLWKDGEDEIFFKGLHARSFYFCDPVGNILEYIVHYNLEIEISGDGAEQAVPVLHVSEIGLPVEDVPACAEQLRTQFGIVSYGGSVFENFAFLGDISGQLVVVRVGRPWLPTDTVLATVSPVEVTIRGQPTSQIQLAPYPYLITATS